MGGLYDQFFKGIQQGQIDNTHVAQGLQLDQIKGIISLLTGNNSGQGGGVFQALRGNNNANSNTNSNQSLQQARQQAIQDTKGLTSAALFDFNSSILPQITSAAEGAGASASALTALLSQNAAAAGAGQVAKQQGAQILGQEGLVNQANIARQNNISQLINTLLSATLGRNNLPNVGGGPSGGGASTDTSLSFDNFFAPRPTLMGFHGPAAKSSSSPLINGQPYK